jgi:hypothetical protein
MNDACFIVCNKNGQARLFLLRGRPGGDGLLLDPLEFVSGSKSAIQRVEEARLKGV